MIACSTVLIEIDSVVIIGPPAYARLQAILVRRDV